jgi:hypothetical protein
MAKTAAPLTDAEVQQMLDTVPASSEGSPRHRELQAEAIRRDLPSTTACPIHGAGCEAWA